MQNHIASNYPSRQVNAEKTTAIKSIVVVLSIFFANMAHAEASLNDQPQPSITLDSLLTPVRQPAKGMSDLRNKMLFDAAWTVGFRGGLAARARMLTDELNARVKTLDTMFQFQTLIGQNGALPPVIVEARDVSAFSDSQIRTATRVYKIQREERFVSVPPTWRDYLLIGLPAKQSIDLPIVGAMPKNDDEMMVWRSAVKSGWTEGDAQAAAILQANFERLVRDYTGMMRYSILLQQGMITRTQVAESMQTVTGDGKELKLGDNLRRLTKKAAFEIDANKWRPTITRVLKPQTAAKTEEDK